MIDRFFVICARAVCLRAIASVVLVVVAAGPLGAAQNPTGEELALSANDGERFFATYVRATAGNDKIALLFHQAGSNRHEYDPIVPVLKSLGFDTLATDQRSGGQGWGYPNRTVSKRGRSSSYAQAYADLQGALDWAVARGYRTIVAVGSSYSASLVIVLAGANPGKLSALASFSPGEYFSDKNRIKKAAASVSIPFYVTAGSQQKEELRVDEVLSRASGVNVRRRRASAGVHGVSTMRKDRNPAGYQRNLEQFKAFLLEVSPR